MKRDMGGRGMGGAKRILGVLCVALVSVALGGCLTVGDDDGAILAIDLYWDEEVGNADFLAGTCYSAGVERMAWVLRDEDGLAVAGREQSCADGIDILNAVPGKYVLKIEGFDEDKNELWSVTCKDLLVLRFNMLYSCDIEAD